MRAFLSSVKKVVVVHMRGRVRSLGCESVLRGMNEGPTASAALRAAPIHGADGEPIASFEIMTGDTACSDSTDKSLSALMERVVRAIAERWFCLSYRTYQAATAPSPGPSARSAILSAQILLH
jgi:hypothetical protein